MLRRAASVCLQRGFAAGPMRGAGMVDAGVAGLAPPTPFVRRAALLKKKFRGKGLYAFAREEARQFLDTEVPKGSVTGWMEEGSNAVALSQLLRFFELQPEEGLSAAMLNRLIRFAEDPATPPTLRLEAVLSLMAARPDENYERAFTTVETVLKGAEVIRQQQQPSALWSVLDLCAKVLQRCGRRVAPTLSDRLAQLVMELLQATPQQEIAHISSSLLRIYAWMVRAELPQSTGVLFVLVDPSSRFKGYDFATMMRSCARHHQTTPLPIDLVVKLAQNGLNYAVTCNGADAAAILGGIARMLSSMEPGTNGVEVSHIRSLADQFNALLEDYQPRVLRFLARGDRLYWQGTDDITSIAFAYELGGRGRYHKLFSSFQEYVKLNVNDLEPPELAMAAGILRRSQRFRSDIAQLLSQRIEVILGELRLSELSHVVASYADFQPRPQWLPEALAVAHRLLQSTETVSAATRFHLAVAFPQENFSQALDYTQMTARQLADALPLALGNPAFEPPIVEALIARLADASAADRFSTDDIFMFLGAPNQAVAMAGQQYLERSLREPEWSTAVLFALPVAMQNASLSRLAADPQKALATAKAAAVSPEQFVALLELLMGIWKDTNAEITEFAVVGGVDLVHASRLRGGTIARYLNCVRHYAAAHPSAAWLSTLSSIRSIREVVGALSGEDLVMLLASLHSLYSSVATTPALQPLLSEVVECSYMSMTQADDNLARATVLLVHLQQGMAMPLLGLSTPQLQRVTANIAAYPEDLQDALKCMPIPQVGAATTRSPEAATVRKGRFTMKQPSGAGTAEPPFQPVASDAPLDLSEGDPFLGGQMASSPTPPPPPTAATAAPQPPHREEEMVRSSEEQQLPVSGSAAAAAAFSASAFQSTPPSPPQQPAAPVDAAAQWSSSSPEQPYQTAAAPHPSGATAAAEKEEDPSHVTSQSYYSKFFNSSIGMLFRAEAEENKPEPVPAPTPAEGPRRTILRPYVVKPAESQPLQQQQQQAVPLGTPFSSTFGQQQQQQQQQQPMMFPSSQWGAPPPPPPQQQQQQQHRAYETPSSMQNASFFDGLFPQRQQQQQHQPPQQSSYGRPMMNFSGTATAAPSQPSPPVAGSSASSRFSPMKAHSHSSPYSHHTNSTGRYDSSGMSPATHNPSPMGGAVAGSGMSQRGSMRQQGFAGSGPLQGFTHGGHVFVDPMRKEPSYAAQPPVPRPGTVPAKTHLRQPTFANMSSDQHKAPPAYFHGATVPPLGDKRAEQRKMLLREPADRPLAWRDAAQQVANVSRYAKPSSRMKSPTHQTLTEWLASPSATLDPRRKPASKKQLPEEEEEEEPRPTNAVMSRHRQSAKKQQLAEEAEEEQQPSRTSSAASGRHKQASKKQQHSAGKAGDARKSKKAAAAAAAASRKDVKGKKKASKKAPAPVVLQKRSTGRSVALKRKGAPSSAPAPARAARKAAHPAPAASKAAAKKKKSASDSKHSKKR